MTDLPIWIGLAGLFGALVAGWVRINMTITAGDVKATADKTMCDAALVQIRAEVVAVEARANSGIRGVSDQITRLDGKIDRLLERNT